MPSNDFSTGCPYPLPNEQPVALDEQFAEDPGKAEHWRIERCAPAGVRRVDRMDDLIFASQWDFFLEHGYLIVEDVLSEQRLRELIETLEARYTLEGDRAGSEGSSPQGVRRLCNLFSKGRALEELAVEPIALEAAKRAIGDDFRWQAMNFHATRYFPGNGFALTSILQA